MTIRALTLTALAGAALAVSACGSGSGTGTSTTSDPQEAALKFAQCMRENGVDMPDPQVDAQGRIAQKIRFHGSKATMDRAQEACKKYQDQARPDLSPEQKTELLDQAVRFSQCMREHGVQLPDPQLSSDGGIIMRIGGPGKGGAGKSSLDPESPAFKTAEKACESFRPKPPDASDGDSK
jgi:hypothetical protein